MFYAGIDIGTTVVKAVVFDTEGRVVQQAHREYDLVYPKPGWRELDSDLVWKRTVEVLRQIGSWEGAQEIGGLSVSVQGEAVTPISRDGKALYNSIVTFDNRTIPQARWWEENFDKEELFHITGQPLHPMQTLNKIMWIRENMPRIFEKTWKFLCYEDLFFYRLGLEPVIDHSLASRTLAFDIIQKRWSDRILSTAKVDADLFARPMPSGEVVGELGSSMARRLGLPPGLPLVTGGHDQPCSALGGGIVGEGVAVDSTGTVECVTPAMSEPILTREMLDSNFPCYCHVKKGMYVTLAFHFGAGSVLKWFRDNFAHEESNRAAKERVSAYKILDDEAANVDTGTFVLPHFVGSGTPYLDPLSKGAIIGLTTSTTRPQLYRAILEGITFETKINIQRLEECGVRIEELRAIGGGATSKIWPQIKADIFEKKVVRLSASEAGCLGAAILAATAVGEYSDVDRAVESCVHREDEFVPEPEASKRYSQKFEIYRQIYETVRKLSWQISG